MSDAEIGKLFPSIAQQHFDVKSYGTAARHDHSHIGKWSVLKFLPAAILLNSCGSYPVDKED